MPPFKWLGTGVVGTSGVNARKTVASVIKHAVGFVTAQPLPMVAKIAPPMVHAIRNLKYATEKVAKVCYCANVQLYVSSLTHLISLP